MSFEVEDQSHLPTLPRKGNYPWFLKVHSSQGWECVEVAKGEWEWLPRLRRFHARPGVNGHTARSGALAKMNDQQAGFVVLDDPKLVARYRKVLRSLPGPSGARSYWLAWDEPMVSGRNVARKRDTAQELEFRRWLVSSGTVPLPDAVHLKATIDLMRKQVSRATRRAGMNPHLAEKLEQDQRQLSAARQAAQSPDGRFVEGPPPLPKSSTRKKVTQ
jgi:hypothetical protein